MNKIFLTNLFAFFLLFTSYNKDDKVEPIVTIPTPSPPSTPVYLDSTDVFSLITGEISGTSTIERYEDSISISLEAHNLIPGHVYILVATTVDRPENCKAIPCTVGNDFLSHQSAVGSVGFQPDGLVADSSSVTFNVTIKERDNTTVPLFPIQDDLSGSLQDALKAEVHLSIRSKGPEIVAHSEEQRTSPTSWCKSALTWNYGEENARIPIQEGECAWILESSHLAPSSVNVNGINAPAFKFYPSPTLDYLTISSTEDINRIDIYDLRGVKLINVPVKNALNQTVDVSSLPSGVFMLMISSDKGIGAKSFIKQ